jgi:hypothetical protein
VKTFVYTVFSIKLQCKYHLYTKPGTAMTNVIYYPRRNTIITYTVYNHSLTLAWEHWAIFVLQYIWISNCHIKYINLQLLFFHCKALIVFYLLFANHFIIVLLMQCVLRINEYRIFLGKNHRMIFMKVRNLHTKCKHFLIRYDCMCFWYYTLCLVWNIRYIFGNDTNQFIRQ